MTTNLESIRGASRLYFDGPLEVVEEFATALAEEGINTWTGMTRQLDPEEAEVVWSVALDFPSIELSR